MYIHVYIAGYMYVYKYIHIDIAMCEYAYMYIYVHTYTYSGLHELMLSFCSVEALNLGQARGGYCTLADSDRI